MGAGRWCVVRGSPFGLAPHHEEVVDLVEESEVRLLSQARSYQRFFQPTHPFMVRCSARSDEPRTTHDSDGAACRNPSVEVRSVPDREACLKSSRLRRAGALGALAGMRVEDRLAQPDRFRRHLDQLVLLDDRRAPPSSERRIGGVSSRFSSLPAARTLVSCLPLSTLTSRSLPRLCSPTIMPS